MTDLCLSADEIYDLTGKVRPTAQLKELRRLKIDAELRGNKTVLVYRGSLPMKAAARAQMKNITPNLDAIATPS